MRNTTSTGFAAGLSTCADTSTAITEVCQQLISQLDSCHPHLILVFFSAEHVPASEAMGRAFADRFPSCQVLGCSGETIVGGEREIEVGPALSVWAACLPQTNLTSMHLQFARTPEGSAILGWPEELPKSWPTDSTLLIFGDPYTFPIEVLVELVNEEHPGIPVIGGMASTASQPGENRLLLGSNALNHGAVAVLIDGSVRVQSVVSQGCRPIGQPMIVTRAERNVILELGGLPAYRRLVEVFQSLATREQEQVRRGLHVGRVVSEYRDRFEQGDFLVRNVLGVDAESGAITVGDYIRTGQTVQFHVRDWETADGEMRQMLAACRRQPESSPSGALLFSCNGRGTRLFPEPNHDAQLVGSTWQGLPLAGFFAAGELGPVGGKNFVHGFTASVALFYSPPHQSAPDSPSSLDRLS